MLLHVGPILGCSPSRSMPILVQIEPGMAHMSKLQVLLQSGLMLGLIPTTLSLNHLMYSE